MAKAGGIELAKLMRSGDYSDMTLVCEGHEFKAHRAVVCSQSRVIGAAMEGRFEVDPPRNSENDTDLEVGS